MLLVVGALFGIGLAAWDLTERAPEEQPLRDDVVVVVNGNPILRAEYERAVAAVSADRGGGDLTREERRRVLERLIDEELLVQRGIELGLPHRDRQLRNQISAAVIGLFASRAGARQAEEPSDEELRAFFGANEEWFRDPVQVRLEHLFFAVDSNIDDEEARVRARDVGLRLQAGETFDGLATTGDPYEAPLPSGALHLRQVRDLLGPTVGRVVFELDVGVVSEPVRSGSGYHLVRVVERVPGRLPPFESIRDVVLNEYQRRSHDRELRRFLDEQRRIVSIQIAPDLQ